MKILVGVATTSVARLGADDKTIVRSGPDRRFLETLPNFFNECGKRFPHIQFEVMWVWNKPLVDAQNDFAEHLMEIGHDYLLTIEDDHWNFTADMLDACLKANTHVCGIPYRSRHFPFEVVPMKHTKTKENGVKLYSGMNDKELRGYQEADLMGFGFTLIKSDCFRILDRPYFRLNILHHQSAAPLATDINFCSRLIDKGIHPIGCFDYRLNHRDISEDRYTEMLVAGILTQHSMFTAIENIHRYKRVQESFNRNKLENDKLKENK